MARPDKLSPKLTRQLCQGIRDTGASLADVARSVGVSERTFHRWMASGADVETASPRFRQFWQALTRARAERMMRDLKAITAAARLDWRAAAWRLTRMDAQQWGDRSQVGIELNKRALLEVSKRVLPADAYLRVLAGCADDLAMLEATQYVQARAANGQDDDDDETRPGVQ